MEHYAASRDIYKLGGSNLAKGQKSIRAIGQKGNRKFSAVKVWDKREFKNLSSDVELGTRNIKVALRKLRKFARTGASEQLDVPTTIGETAKKGGLLDIHMAPERHNAVKVLMFFDVGGSMDPHVKSTQELFSAVQSEFKYLKALQPELKMLD